MSKGDDLKYLVGFGNHFATEALPGALPLDQNSPQVCNYGLYSEQLTGTAFTAPRHKNQRSWLYRIRPTVCHTAYSEVKHHSFDTKISEYTVTPNQLRWDPVPLLSSPGSAPTVELDFVDGLSRIAGSGDEVSKKGLSIYTYSINRSMDTKSFQNSDGDFLIVSIFV